MTSVDVQFPYNNAKLSVVDSARLRRREFEHEILVVETSRLTGSQLRLRSMDPVIVRLKGISNAPITFVGYVHEIHESGSRAVADHKHEIICVGPTYRMMQSRQKTWRDVTISDVARTLAKNYRLTADVENHSLRLSSLHQTGESDWAFLCRLARQFGYVVYPVGTTLHFHSRGRDLLARQNAAIKRVYRQIPDDSSQVFEFNAALGEATVGKEGRTAVRVAGGVDKHGQIFRSYQDTLTAAQRGTTSSGLFAVNDLTINAQSPEELQARLRGAQERTLYKYIATSHMMADPRTRPGSMIYLEGLDNGYDGFWTVTGVDHHFDNLHQYRMDVNLGTDSLGKPKATWRPQRVVDTAQRKRSSTSRLSQPWAQGHLSFLANRGSYNSPFAWQGSIDTVEPVTEGSVRPAYLTQRIRRVTSR